MTKVNADSSIIYVTAATCAAVVTGESVSRSFPPLEPIVHVGNGLWLGSNIFIDVGHLGPRVPKQIGRGDPRAISSSRATATEVDLYAFTIDTRNDTMGSGQRLWFPVIGPVAPYSCPCTATTVRD